MSSLLEVVEVLNILGSFGFWSFIALAIGLSNRRNLSFLLFTSLLIDFAINKTLKYSLMMPRPDSSLWLVNVETIYGFPSGHTEASFLVATLLSAQNRRFIPLYAFAMLIGISRIFLGVHFPVDVIGGGILGIIIGIAINYTYQKKLYIAIVERKEILVALTCLSSILAYVFCPVRREIISGFILGVGMSVLTSYSLPLEIKKIHMAFGFLVLCIILMFMILSKLLLLRFLLALISVIWVYLMYPRLVVATRRT